MGALDEMIAGKRVILRPWPRSDLQIFVKWINDPEVTIYAGDAYPALSMEQEELYNEKHINDEHTCCIETSGERTSSSGC